MKRQLYIGASALAITSVMAGSSMAQESTLDAYSPTLNAFNVESVTLQSTPDGTIDVNVGHQVGATPVPETGTGSSAGGSVIGASSNATVTTIDGQHTAVQYGKISAASGNMGEISASGVNVNINSSLGTAASGVISATGATTSISEIINGDNVLSHDGKSSIFSAVRGTSRNAAEGSISVSGSTLTSHDLTGTSASMSISAGGASTNIGTTLIGAGSTNQGFQAGVFGNENVDDFEYGVMTGAYNAGEITASNNKLETGELAEQGVSASASISTFGTSTSIRATLIDSNIESGPAFGDILQYTRNTGDVSSRDNSVMTGTANGIGSSVAVSATGAAGTVGISTVNSQINSSDTIFGNITRTEIPEIPDPEQIGIQNTGDISVTNGTVIADGLSGMASSAAVTATGALDSVYESHIGYTGSSGDIKFGAIDTNVYNSGNISVNNSSVNIGQQQGGNLDVADIFGTGASASLSGAGAAAYVTSTTIASEGSHPGATFDEITQTVKNIGSVTIGGDNNQDTISVKVGDILGTAASTSISASGASAGVSTSAIMGENINLAGDTLAEFSGVINQTVASGDPSSSSGEMVKIENATINTGNISGTAASAAITASGASASISASMIDSGTNSMMSDAGVFQSPVTQTVNNDTDVSITGSSIFSGELSGVAASASIAAIGASASASDSIINGSRTGSGATLADLTQTASNGSAITVSNSQISVANLTGTGASAMISVVGASASAGVSTIN